MISLSFFHYFSLSFFLSFVLSFFLSFFLTFWGAKETAVTHSASARSPAHAAAQQHQHTTHSPLLFLAGQRTFTEG
jgi:hypothetical protein